MGNLVAVPLGTDATKLKSSFKTRTYHRYKSPSHQIIDAWASLISLLDENAMSIEIRLLQSLRILINSAVQVDDMPKALPGIIVFFFRSRKISSCI